MLSDTRLSDNQGHRVSPYGAADPKQGTGVLLTAAAADTAYTQTVVAGKQYIVTASLTGGFYFGTDGVVTTPANVAWVCPLGQTIVIVIPAGVTTLHYAADTIAAVGYLREMNLDMPA